jgi:hypothetical protein
MVDQKSLICYNNSILRRLPMTDPVELYCTQDDDDGAWLVWFPHPLGGMHVLDTFDNETAARQFWQEQINSMETGE